jgi:hypothetical protein
MTVTVKSAAVAVAATAEIKQRENKTRTDMPSSLHAKGSAMRFAPVS